MAKFEKIIGGKYELAAVTSGPISDSRVNGSVSGLSPEQWFRLWSTGRDGENFDTYEAELAIMAALDVARERTLHIIQGGEA